MLKIKSEGQTSLGRKDAVMKNASDPYEDIALTYTHFVRQESAEAGEILDRIRTDFGAPAALRSALIIAILKKEVQQNDWLPNIGLYAHLLGDYPDALALTKEAMTCCLQRWASPSGETGEWISSATAYLHEGNSKQPLGASVPAMAAERLTVLEPENLGKGGRFHSQTGSEPRLRIVSVADNRFAQTILGLFVAAHSDMTLVGEADDCTQAVEMAAQTQPDILLMDFNLLALDGIATIRQIKLDNPRIHIILLTAEPDPERLRAAVGAGAAAYLPQITLSDRLAEVIRTVSQAT
jgi:CheY-like chemotaxis protein